MFCDTKEAEKLKSRKIKRAAAGVRGGMNGCVMLCIYGIKQTSKTFLSSIHKNKIDKGMNTKVTK